LFKLGRRDYSAHEMNQLIRKRATESGQTVDPRPIVEKLVEEEIISDSRYIESQVRMYTGTSNIKGPRELRRNLMQQGGIAEDILDDYIDENDEIWNELSRKERDKTLFANGFQAKFPLFIPEKLYHKLKQKLYRKGFTRDQINFALEGISPEREIKPSVTSHDVQKLIDRQQSSGKGPIAVRQFLKQKGIEESTIQDHFDDDDETWISSAKYVMDKRFGPSAPSTKTDRGKRVKYLMGRGFLMKQINAALEF
jgi:regulatory protein